jgi:hypothetical protein
MSYPIYYVEENDVLPILFDSFDGGTGASVTLSGLAVTDIEIYKDGSVTQRASDAGYTLLDTDGIDFDSVTGIHGFSINLSDNTDAGFYSVGPWYHVVVSSVTIDAQTVNFIAAAFRIVSATRGLAGTALPAAAADAAGGLPISDAGGLDLDAKIGALTYGTANRVNAQVYGMEANVLTATAINADAITAAKVAADVTTEIQSGLATAAALATVATVVDAIKVITDALGATAAARLALSAGQIIPFTVDTTVAPSTTEFEADDITEATADHYNGRIVIFTSGVLVGQATSISDYALAGGKGHFTVAAMTEAPGNNDTGIIV